MGKALYRKYRSKSFDEVIGQDHITKTLSQAIKSGNISHAYLFTGPRGVGKTSVARIFAHEVNKLSYTDDSMHLDIIEIDAASNRRIDEIRDLRDKVYITPASAKYKVYIIDEVHMLTREAFNALLKTLEEPPAHCIFILATTEAHKLPETIVSRTQRFSFKPIDKLSAVNHLNTLAEQEKIEITPEALGLLAEHGQGSFRDSISLLDQLSVTSKKITEKDVREVLGLPSISATRELIDQVASGNSSGVLSLLESLSDQGANPSTIAKELSRQLRNLLIDGLHEIWVPKLLNQLLEVSASTHPYEKLEISLLEASNTNTATGINIENKIDTKPSGSSKDFEKEKNTPKHKYKDKSEDRQEIQETAASFSLESWPEIVTYIKNHAASLHTALRLAKPRINDASLVLHFQFPLHQKKVNQAKHKEAVAQAIEELTGAKVKIECIVDKKLFEDGTESSSKIPGRKQEEAAAPQLQTISNIFGKSEVLES